MVRDSKKTDTKKPKKAKATLDLESIAEQLEAHEAITVKTDKEANLIDDFMQKRSKARDSEGEGFHLVANKRIHDTLLGWVPSEPIEIAEIQRNGLTFSPKINSLTDFLLRGGHLIATIKDYNYCFKFFVRRFEKKEFSEAWQGWSLKRQTIAKDKLYLAWFPSDRILEVEIEEGLEPVYGTYPRAATAIHNGQVKWFPTHKGALRTANAWRVKYSKEERRGKRSQTEPVTAETYKELVDQIGDQMNLGDGKNIEGYGYVVFTYDV